MITKRVCICLRPVETLGTGEYGLESNETFPLLGVARLYVGVRLGP